MKDHGRRVTEEVFGPGSHKYFTEVIYGNLHSQPTGLNITILQMRRLGPRKNKPFVRGNMASE